ncbi:MAG: response regulator [Eubacteriales bacterium]|nr:response regulator [Eubacteriales bacterium]
MRAVCVDDDRLSLQNTLGLCRQMPQVQSAEGFTRARDVLKWMESNPVELAILDIHMPEMDGLALARRIREQNPETAILFLSAHPQYAADAWAIHPTGYVLKPLTEARLAEELVYAAQWLSRPGQKPGERRVEVKTFGNFDVFVDGGKVRFSRTKAKELLACLVDRRGIRMTRAEAFHVLWDEEEYSRPKQKILDVIIRNLRATLEENRIGDVLELEQGTLRVVPEKLHCDYYRLLRGEEDAIREYQGEYMSAYTWASGTEGYIESRLRNPIGTGGPPTGLRQESK